MHYLYLVPLQHFFNLTMPSTHQANVFENAWKQEERLITEKAAETSWPLTAFCCAFFILVETGNGQQKDNSIFYFLDFGSAFIIFLAYLLRKHVRYPYGIITYGTSVLITLVATFSAAITSPENVFTYFLIVSLVIAVRGLLYCQEVKKVAMLAIWGHATLFITTWLFREEPYFSMTNITSTNVIQAFMVLFSLSGANSRYKITRSNFISNLKISQASQVIADKNRDITDGINYARRIQTSQLPGEDYLSAHLNAYFMFFQPRDIVSGDFYWASQLADGRMAVVVADSTGHGVPGAIMSMLNISCLNEAINEQKLTSPEMILHHTRSSIMHHMANDGSAEGGKDGMDAAIVCIDFELMSMSVAMANNPVWIVRQQQLIELQPDKIPVGKPMGSIRPFTRHDVALCKGDIIVMTTDGYADQFGGPHGKKYMYKPMKELILKIGTLPMHEASSLLRDTFETWRGEHEQVDDVLVFGIKV